MPKFSQSMNDIHRSSSNDSSVVFKGNVDGDWTVGFVPQGGYGLALVTEAVMKHQSDTSHPDPFHVTGHFVRSVSIAAFEVHVRVFKQGKGFTNLLADLVQNDQIRISAHLIFGNMSDHSQNQRHLTVIPPSPYARRIPLPLHPSQATGKPALPGKYRFHKHVKWATDTRAALSTLRERAKSTNANTAGGPGIEWNAWVQMDEDISLPCLAFIADLMPNTPNLMPEESGQRFEAGWFPTMVMSVEFKAKMPKDVQHSNRTVGLYSTGRFMDDPQGRHDLSVELWTAPSNIEEGQEEDGWRGQQRCIAIATQMALSLPMEANMRKKARM